MSATVPLDPPPTLLVPLSVRSAGGRQPSGDCPSIPTGHTTSGLGLRRRQQAMSRPGMSGFTSRPDHESDRAAVIDDGIVALRTTVILRLDGARGDGRRRVCRAS